jgi:hypothetical protein
VDKEEIHVLGGLTSRTAEPIATTARTAGSAHARWTMRHVHSRASGDGHERIARFNRHAASDGAVSDVACANPVVPIASQSP